MVPVLEEFIKTYTNNYSTRQSLVMRKVKKLLRDSRQTQVITVIFPSVLWETLLQFLTPCSQDPQGQNFSKYY